MDLIANFESEETFSKNNNLSELKVLTSAISLLITYIQVDLSKFPTRKSFPKTLSSLVRNGAKVIQFAYTMEKHKRGNGGHYYM